MKTHKVNSQDIAFLIREKLYEISNNLDIDFSLIDDDTDLYSSGILDSFDLADLLLCIEAQTSCRASVKFTNETDKIKISINYLCSLFKP